MKINLPYSVLRVIVNAPEFKTRQAAKLAVKRSIRDSAAIIPSVEQPVENIQRKTSWGFPLLSGETEVAQGLIKDANGVLWIINDAKFHKSQISVQIRHDGKIIDQAVYTNDDVFIGAKKTAEATFKDKHNQQIEIIAFMTAGASENKGWYYVYGPNEQPKYDNLNGIAAVYKARTILNGKLSDSAPVFSRDYDTTANRALFAAVLVPCYVSLYADERDAVLRAIDPCVRTGR